MHRTRSFRRKQLIKKKHRFEKIAVQGLFSLDKQRGILDKEEVYQWAVREASTPKTPCQCCCNPRHSVLYKQKDKLTMQEKKDILTKREAREEGTC